MPWKVEKRSGDKPFKVVKEGSGEVVASHSTREKAQAQVRALYANTDEGGKKHKVASARKNMR